MLIGLIVLLILYFIISWLHRQGRVYCVSLHTALKESLFYHAFIRYQIESNLDLTNGTIFFLSMFSSFETSLDTTNTVIRLTFLIVIIIWIIFATAFPLVRFDRLANEDVKGKFSSLYDQTRISSRFPALYTAVFCVRRLLMILI